MRERLPRRICSRWHPLTHYYPSLYLCVSVFHIRCTYCSETVLYFCISVFLYFIFTIYILLWNYFVSLFLYFIYNVRLTLELYCISVALWYYIQKRKKSCFETIIYPCIPILVSLYFRGEEKRNNRKAYLFSETVLVLSESVLLCLMDPTVPIPP